MWSRLTTAVLALLPPKLMWKASTGAGCIALLDGLCSPCYALLQHVCLHDEYYLPALLLTSAQQPWHAPTVFSLACFDIVITVTITAWCLPVVKVSPYSSFPASQDISV